MPLFADYARYYDLLYQDKDYRGEAGCIAGLIRAHRPGARSLLNLGCGSGRHDGHLAGQGFELCGVDLSEDMIARAKAAAAGSSLEYRVGDVRTVRLGRTFDAVISLFHVMSYQLSHEDLRAAFETARIHLADGGIFIFDCWYGPGVLTDPPAVRVLEREDEALKILRISRPTHHSMENLVEVAFHVLVKEKATLRTEEFEERHRMRYFFLPELRQTLLEMGLRMLHCHESFHPEVEPSLRTWSLTVVAGCR